MQVTRKAAIAAVVIVAAASVFTNKLLAQDTTAKNRTDTQPATQEDEPKNNKVVKIMAGGWLRFNQPFASNPVGAEINIASQLEELSNNGKDAEITDIKTAGKNKLYLYMENGQIEITFRYNDFTAKVFRKAK